MVKGYTANTGDLTEASEYKVYLKESNRNQTSPFATIQTQKLFPKKIKKISSYPGRLGKYEVIEKTKHDIPKNDSQDKINETIDNSLSLLELLHEENMEPHEIESIFANIINDHNTLWHLRTSREKPFSEVLVLLESCLKYYDSNRLTIDKINSLERIYHHLRLNILSSYPSDCRKQLTAVGFDILRPLQRAKEKLKKLF